MVSSGFQFQALFKSLERVGLVDVLLPFLLIFTVIFAVLEKTKILGEAKRNMNVAISMILALLTVIPHVTGNFPAGYDPVAILNSALPSVSLVAVGVIALMILLGVFAHDRLMLGVTAPGWIGLFSVVAIVYIFGSSAGWWGPNFIDWMDSSFGSDVVAVVIMLLVFGIIIAFVTGGGEREKIGALNRIGFDMSKLFGGK